MLTLSYRTEAWNLNYLLPEYQKQQGWDFSDGFKISREYVTLPYFLTLTEINCSILRPECTIMVKIKEEEEKYMWGDLRIVGKINWIREMEQPEGLVVKAFDDDNIITIIITITKKTISSINELFKEISQSVKITKISNTPIWEKM